MSRFFFWIGCAGFFAYFVSLFLIIGLIGNYVILDELDESLTDQLTAEVVTPSYVGTYGLWVGCGCWLAALIAKAFKK